MKNYKAAMAMNMAKVLRKELELGKSEALTQAWELVHLRADLHVGMAYFTYVKEDGTLREAKGTLCADLIPAGDVPSDVCPKQRTKRYATFTYYDIDKKGWRAFKVWAFVEVQQRKVIKAYGEADRLSFQKKAIKEK